MKQKKSLLILCGILAVLVIAYLGITKYMENKEAKELEEAAQLEADSIIYISNLSEEEIVGVTWAYTENLCFTLVDDTWCYFSDDTIAIQEYYVTSVISTFETLVATRELEGGDSLADYGLEEPRAYVTLELASGEESTFYIGNMAGEDYYLAVDDKETVYTVSSSVISSISYGIADIIENDTFPTITSTQMEEVTITEAGEQVVYTTDDEGVFDSIAGGVGVLNFDVLADVNASTVLENYGLDEDSRIVVEFLYNVTTEVEVVEEESEAEESVDTEDAEDSDLEEMTETEEATVETIVEQFDATLYIGALEEESGYYYFQVEGSNMVYMMISDSIDIILNR
ncbi:MAG: DUF4340 domain-containing protein [Eubacteriales bacterium]